MQLYTYKNQPVALKILESQGLMNVENINRFFKEFFGHHRLKNPHIVKIIGWTNFDYSYAMVMEFMEGGSLLDCKFVCYDFIVL